MKYQVYARHNLEKIPYYKKLRKGTDPGHQNTVSEVLPFKTNNYVVNELIDWDNYLEDPMYILNFPQKEMLKPSQFRALSEMVEKQYRQSRSGQIRPETEAKPESASGRTAGTQCSLPEGEGIKRNSTQVSGNHALLPHPGTNLPCLLHLLFQMAPVHRSQ